jgi:bacterioferritin (cytochrome b1)
MSDEKMEVSTVIEKLNSALSLQYRSVLQYTLTAGSILGFEGQSLTNQLWTNAEAELADARRLVEKITGLGGQPTTDLAAIRHHPTTGDASEWLITSETEAIDALREVIPHTGNEGRSEALEHLLEHIIMRKQNQVDFLIRAQGAGH